MIHEHIIRFDDEDKDEFLEFMRMTKGTSAYLALYHITEIVRKEIDNTEYEEGCGKTYEILDRIRSAINNEILDQGIDLDRELP